MVPPKIIPISSVTNSKLQSWLNILFESVYAVIAGGQGWTDIRAYVLDNHERFLKQGLFENSEPIDDTFARLIADIVPAEFHNYLPGWMNALHILAYGQVVAIDEVKYIIHFLCHKLAEVEDMLNQKALLCLHSNKL